MININTWPRADAFQHFIQDVKCVISLTADVDVTELVSHCRQNKLRYFPCFMYAVVKAVNKRSQLRMGYDENGDVVIWDAVYPSYVDFHAEDESITRLISEFTPNFEQFYKTVTDDMAANHNKRWFEIKYTHRNTFDISCLPWIYYKSLDLQVVNDIAYLAPVITWGKYNLFGNKLMMPVSIQIHHAVADGYHVAQFYRDLEEEIAHMVPAP